MAQFTLEDCDLGGLSPTLNSANSGGDSARNPGAVFLYVENTDTTSKDVQPNDKNTTKYGTDVDPPSISIAAGSFKVIGPFPREDFGDPLEWTYPSGVTGVNVAPIRLTGVVPK